MIQRKYLNIHLNDHSVKEEMWEGEQLVKSGRERWLQKPANGRH